MSKKRKRAPRPVYFTVRRLVDPATGEEVKALAPRGWADRRLMNERSYRVGDEVRVTLSKPRNYQFHKLVHQLGSMMVIHVEALQGLDSHEAIKRLQRESGICCEEQEIEIPGLGSLTVKVARSIAFDSMDEADFQHLWTGICDHIARTYWPDLSGEEIADMAELMPRQVAA